MTRDTLVLENLTVSDLPPAWVKEFHSQPEQRFTVYIIAEVAKPFDIYKQLELGEGGYAKVPSSEVKAGIKATLQSKLQR